MNKQTAVEWLFLMLNNPNRNQDFANKLLDKAKAIEEQNQLDLIRFLKTQDKMGKSVEDLYEQFKSEQNESI
jgi:hypothetical protein